MLAVLTCAYYYYKNIMNIGHKLHAVLTAAIIRVITRLGCKYYSLRKQTCFCLYDLVYKIIMSCNIECEILMLCV